MGSGHSQKKQLRDYLLRGLAPQRLQSLSLRQEEGVAGLFHGTVPRMVFAAPRMVPRKLM